VIGITLPVSINVHPQNLRASPGPLPGIGTTNSAATIPA
jgi:hypothetical protein